ncbi:MAG: trypsin-like peptidase domain-containing protein [Methanomassiliicoccales archaeon]
MLKELQENALQVLENISPAVVSLETSFASPRYRWGPFGGSATGVVLSADRIVTNNHAVQSASKIKVSLPNGETLNAAVKAADPLTDIAVLKTESKVGKYASLGNSDLLKPGMIVFAIGNALGMRGAPTISMGVISAVGRQIPGFSHVSDGMIQTDAAINPGNSGGPLVDLDGKVVGINTALVPFAQGIGFAIPSNTVASIIAMLDENGEIRRPWMGVYCVDVSRALMHKNSRGALIVGIESGSPADAAGLEEGDVIIGIADREVRNSDDLVKCIQRLKEGETVDVKFVRDFEMLETKITLKGRAGNLGR